MGKIHFLIPTLKSFSVKDYALFSSDWTFNLKSGLNLFLGINAIGKTTSIKMIVFGFVGPYKDLEDKIIDPAFFIDRIDNNKKDLQPYVSLSFSLGNTQLNVSRSIRTGKIVALKLNDEEIESSDLDEVYVFLLQEHGNIDSIKDLTFILQHLVVREEEGSYLFWSQEEQLEVIRIIGFDKKLQAEFKSLYKKLQEADSEYKRKADYISQIRRRQRMLIKTQEELDSTSPAKKSREEFSRELNGLIEERDKRQSAFNALVKREAELEGKWNSNEGEIIEIESQLENLSKDYRTIENSFYQNAFDTHTNELDMILDKINSHSSCSLCNTKLSREKVRIVNSKYDSSHCPICESQLKIVNEGKRESTDIKKLEILSAKIEKLKQHYKVLNDESAPILNQLAEIRDKIHEHNRSIRNLNISILSVKKDIDDNYSHGVETISEIEVKLKRNDEEIEEIRPQAEKLLAVKNELIINARQKHNELNDELKDIKGGLLEIFHIYSSIFFTDSVDLFLKYDTKPKGLEVNSPYFLPVLDRKTRLYQTQVSTSEANILEYIFRISLLQMHYNVTGNKPTTIIETSEGSFDVGKTIRLGKTIKEFGKNDFPITIITNLSKIEFLKQIIPEEERKDRCFQILKYAKMDSETKNVVDKNLEELKLT
ncbi:hypothetical protein C9994_07815 [Marivirga lumbricoides]|uniref:Rad50/SbcC-type AAA domain-containing protein n=1 Tax=Marivirga lumbricoides TaxID=1046115 RepID=A0A2T4DRB0_9BACT|nr:hypothetical protein C9994_07815 [Marivirga lumbricoides]